MVKLEGTGHKMLYFFHLFVVSLKFNFNLNEFCISYNLVQITYRNF